MNDVVIGIDPSINSTGICIKKGDSTLYYMIVSKATKKMQDFSNPHIKIIQYDKKSTKGLEYSEKEYIKSCNLCSLGSLIESIIKIYKPIHVLMEGISYGSVSGSSLADLSGLNYIIRMILTKYGVKFTIIPPTAVKKFAVANGSADKDIMIDAWKRLEPKVADIKDIKIDDLADSYFIANYNP